MDSSAGTAALLGVERILSGCQSGFELVEGAAAGSIERFAVLPSRNVPRLLLPLPVPAMHGALGGFLGSRWWLGGAAPLIRVASALGRPRMAIGRELSLLSESGARSPLRELLASVLERDDFHLAMRLSFGRPNAKTVVGAITDSGEILCFAKLGSEAMTDDLVAHESGILERFARTDSPIVLPRLIYSGSWAGNGHILITEALRLEALPRRADSAHRAADRFAAMSQVATSTLRESGYWQQLLERTREADEHGKHGEPGTVVSEAVRKIDAIWGDSRFDFGASHGDWSRANVGLVDGRVAALDWERCVEVAPRGIDIAHFAVLEASSRARRGSFDVELVARRCGEYLAAADRPAGDAKALVMLDCLEMVIRFSAAQRAGLRTTDLKFEPALQAGLLNWSA